MDLAARFHAYFNSIGHPGEASEVSALFDHVVGLLRESGLDNEDGRYRLAAVITENVLAPFSEDPHRSGFILQVAHIVNDLLKTEGFFELPRVDWSEDHSYAKLWEIRDHLTLQKTVLEDLGRSMGLAEQMLQVILEPVVTACPAVFEGADEAGGMGASVPLQSWIKDFPAVLEKVFQVPFAADLEEAGLFARLRERLVVNAILANGGNPGDLKDRRAVLRLPTKAPASEPAKLIEDYLDGTPLAAVFSYQVPFVIPEKTRFEHHHIVAGSGHGKTQTLQYLIARDLERACSEKLSVVVIDSQGDLIRNIGRLKLFAPGGPLHDRVCIVDPEDVKYPVALNLFDIGADRLDRYSQLDRERLTNSVLELYDFVLGSLLSAEMTQKQNVVFRYITRLMLHIPDATIHTFRELLVPGGETRYREHIEKLRGTARAFFETEYSHKSFEDTRRQVVRRLWGILENQTFERMFSHPRNKLDLFAELNAGKIILINTAKDLLKEQGTQILGRFFIAMIAQAAQERATLPEKERTKTFVYVDEAQDYFDRNTGVILSQARKYSVGMVLAHQGLFQLESKLQEAFSANTSIKFAGGVSVKDARAFAPMLHCAPEFIEAQPKGTFAAHIRGVSDIALPLHFPLGHMENLEQMDKREHCLLRKKMRARYAVHYTEVRCSDNHEAEPSESDQGVETAPKPQTKEPKAARTRKPRRGKSDQNLDEGDTGAADAW